MLASLLRRRWPIPVALAVLIAAILGLAFNAAGDAARSIVVYNGRSHYGDEQVFDDFEAATGIDVVLRGGTAPELFERLRQEGDDTPADVLITTDVANLWRAEDAGLLQPVDTPTLEANVPVGLHDPDGHWWAVSTRLRIPVVSTERVGPDAVASYEDLGDPQWKGRLCLRTSNNDYNQSLVADMIAKRGADETRLLLESWMANDPQIVNSDGELLAVMADGQCDVGLSNHYYLGRALIDNPDFPVAPAWPDQDGAGAHANVSGVGLVTYSDHRDDAIALMEYLTTPDAQRLIAARSEFPVNPSVPPLEQFAEWGDVTIDPIDVQRAGPLTSEAITLMLEVGWN